MQSHSDVSQSRFSQIILPCYERHSYRNNLHVSTAQKVIVLRSLFLHETPIHPHDCTNRQHEHKHHIVHPWEPLHLVHHFTHISCFLHFAILAALIYHNVRRHLRGTQSSNDHATKLVQSVQWNNYDNSQFKRGCCEIPLNGSYESGTD